MRVLIIKTSSMGDIIHALPALSDATQEYPGILFDWVVEESFAEIPAWHTQVNQIIPVALRRWRKQLFSQQTWSEWADLLSRLKQERYDLILDMQGLVKSAFLSYFAKGKRAGLDWKSARESLASLFYQKKIQVNSKQHAIYRMRTLMGKALNFAPDFNAPLNYGIKLPKKVDVEKPYLVFLHGTTWKTKQWPEKYWQQLVALAEFNGYAIKISGGNEEEVARAKRIAGTSEVVEVRPYQTITAMASLLANSQGAIAVDTGFAHLAAALKVPLVSLYGSTNPDYTGALSNNSIQLKANFNCAPCLRKTCNYRQPTIIVPACFESLTPNMVWEAVARVLSPI